MDTPSERLRSEQLVAPELVDLEVLSTLRWVIQAGHLDERLSGQTLDDLATPPLASCFLPRVWELRENLSTYDATYVAMAETLNAFS